MAFLVLDIETIPRPTIDESVEEVIAQKTQARVERTGDDPENAESLIRSTSPFLDKFYVLVYAGCRMMELQKIR